MNKYFFGAHLDFLGSSASFLCAIHCALLPFVTALGIIGAGSWLADSRIEGVFITVSAILAVTSLYPSYKTKHHNTKALVIVGIGFFFLVASRFFEHGNPLEVVALVVGGLFITVAHYVNWQLLKTTCSCCEHTSREAV